MKGMGSRALSVSTLDEAPALLAAAERHGFGLEYTGFADARALARPGVEAFAASPLRPRVSALHGPYLDLVPGSMDEGIAAVTSERITRALEACEELGIGRVVFHSGWTRPIYPDWLWVENNVRFWKGILAKGPRGALILVENVFEPAPDRLVALVDEVGDEGLRICLDVGHANLCSPLGVEPWIEGLGPRIGHVHLHNNHGREDEHNGIHGGSLDIPALCELLKRECPEASWNLEIRNGYEESMAALAAARGGPAR
jgi:sugar phosphate isomerase/epimerase